MKIDPVSPSKLRRPFNRVVMRQRAESVGIEESEMIERVRQAIPLGRWGDPRDVADAVTFLCGSSAAWITGETLRVSGGLVEVSAAPCKRPISPDRA